jgi:hypothetical protein
MSHMADGQSLERFQQRLQRQLIQRSPIPNPRMMMKPFLGAVYKMIDA